MKLINILTELWCSPWTILPSMHKQMCAIVQAHLDGSAHTEAGIATAFDGEEKDAFAVEIVNGVAVIPVNGVIGNHVGSMEKSSGATDIRDITQAVKMAVDNPAVSAILLDVNSPGGSVSGAPEAALAVAQATLVKPVISFTDSQMASGAYWLAAGSDLIVSSKSALVGSIGVYMAWLDDSRALEMQGYKAEIIKHGKFKGMGLSGTSLTDESRAILQNSVDEVYSWFTEHVKLFREDVEAETMEGQVFYADEARERDLIDIVGSRDDALIQAIEMADEKRK